MLTGIFVFMNRKESSECCVNQGRFGAHCIGTGLFLTPIRALGHCCYIVILL